MAFLIYKSMSRFCFQDCFQEFFFLFDQSERLFAGLSKADLGFGTGSSRVIAAAGMLFDKLRFVEFAVAVYVVRSEFVVSALTMFQEFSISSAQIDNFATFNPENRPEAFTDLVSINIVHGINSLENIDAFNSYRAKFLASCRTLDFEKLANTLSLRSKNDANTFYTHLAGYVIEHFVDLDIEIKNFAEGRTDNKELVLEKFFQFLREEYAHLKQDETSKQIIDLTLYTLAVENQRTMLPLTSIELAGLAHHPLSEVADCLEFLESKGIVACRIESSKRFRIVHDLITDHIISSQYISVANAHKDFIAQLSETQSDKKEFIVPEITPNIFDVFSSKNRITIPQVIILASIAFCIVRLFLPNFIFDWMAPINESLNFMLPGVVQTFGHNSWYYFPIIFMQGFWVSYMYYLDRGYFCYVLKSEGWIVRSLSKYSSPAGGIAGCLFAFAPSLMAVPIIVGALGCATVYLVHSYSSNIGGFIRHNNTELSAKIYFMALLMVAWTFVLGRVLVPYGENGVDPTACLIIWLSSIGLFGYWWAMRTRQGSQAGRSSMLTMYERGRKKQ